MKGISKKRIEMGEEKWRIYQIEKRREKYRKWMRNHKDDIKKYNKSRANYAVFWRSRAKEELIQYKGGKCCKCGYNKNVPRAYDFHHRNPDKKEFSISNYSVLNIDKLRKEVDKCDLVCRNCHAEIHDEKYKDIRDLMKEKHERYMASRTPTIIRKCEVCLKDFKQKGARQICCSVSCLGIKNRKVEKRPSLDELKNMINSMTMVAIGKKYGVSNNAVKKWARKYGLIK